MSLLEGAGGRGDGARDVGMRGARLKTRTELVERLESHTRKCILFVCVCVRA